jgi:hypothetical protein
MSITISTRKMTAKEQIVYDLGYVAGIEEFLKSLNTDLYDDSGEYSIKGVTWKQLEYVADKVIEITPEREIV